MVHHWVLYGTQGCHLCEQAQAIIEQLQQEFKIECKQVDIAQGQYAEQLVQRLGERIPVLENTQQQAGRGIIKWGRNILTITCTEFVGKIEL